MRLPILAIFALFAAGPALADDVWQQIDTNPGAYWVASPGTRQLEVHCTGDALMMVLFGGQDTLPAEVQTETDLTLTLHLTPGPSREITASWLGPFDNALNGDFPSDPGFLDAFARASRMAIATASGALIVDMPMDGANFARFGFGEVCGL